MTRTELLRRLVHILVGTGAYLVPVIGVDAALVLALVAIPVNAWLLPHLPWFRNVIRQDGSGTRAIWLYPCSCALLLALFHDRPQFAQAGWLALGVGDGLAPFAAMLIGGPTWPWNPRKRAGVSACAAALAGLAAAPVVGWRGAAAVAAAGTLADGLPIEDNVSWPILCGFAAWAAASWA